MVVTRGAGGGQTINAAELTGQGAAAPVNLLLPDGSELTLDDNRSYSVGVRMLASKAGAQAAASIVYELLVSAHAGALTIAANTLSTLNAPGWGSAFTNPGGLTLRVTCTPNLDTVRFAARLDWTSLPGA